MGVSFFLFHSVHDSEPQGPAHIQEVHTTQLVLSGKAFTENPKVVLT